ncbi:MULTISPECIES: MFS transporter [Hydrogenophaga]|jgi:MFS family permease|uniref:H+ Antiporter protein n=1 Tax=Hydrogenophaga intermedia TaxID=65786 RepID=A0A1L1PTW9_HYDIT|nr:MULTISPECIES: MFS transporter [Hydrogenophaga]AOS81711.1 MFS transporter [Hydrogenophaga sp. PBC]TMU71778.1 MFS transporter [Hydrogenophaga intermedia]CDN88101.1 H+ Antiporter protein [Hydrogenophaga intermedia]
MLSVLRHRTYRHLFGAQAIALIGTGLATVALSLLAFELAGQDAGLVLGTALAIKMVAYVGIAPIATAMAQRLPRRRVLVSLDLLRAAVALSLPFVTQIWQIYALIFLLQAASAAFTPTFQATIPDVLPDEQEYTKALSLSRLAYDLESLLSPMLAAALLGVMSFHALFGGTVLGFLASALLVVSVTLPGPEPVERRSLHERTTRGLRIYLATPRLRGLLAISFGVAAAGAMVFVNTVVLVQAQWGLPQNALALALASFGAGSMVAALGLPRLLERWPDRPVMLGGIAMLCGLMATGMWLTSYPPLLLLWFLVGAAYATAQTPSGRLLRRSAHPTDRPALFAAQFALSHACWLLFYPLAGWAGAHWGMRTTFAVLASAVLLALCVAWRVWPADDPEVIEHDHDDGTHHAHAFRIDDQHPHWPS